MADTEVFVVRIYRRQAQQLTGVVESVETGLSSPFHTLDELNRILRTPPPGKQHAGAGTEAGPGGPQPSR